MSRPCGSYGEVARVMLQKARDHGPGTVRVLAERAQVGYGTARYTASRLVSGGDLVVLDGSGRPAVLAVPPAGDALGDKLDELHRVFWDQL